MNEQLKQIASILDSIPNLPHFANAAIMREVSARISQWLYVTKDLSDAVASSSILCDLSNDVDWCHVMSLIAHYGGQRLYITQQMSDNHPVVKAIGVDAAAYFAKRYGGETLNVPKADDVLKAARDKAIIADYRSGMSPNEIASKHNLAYPWVLKLVLNACEPDYIVGGPRRPEVPTKRPIKAVERANKKNKQQQSQPNQPAPEKITIG